MLLSKKGARTLLIVIGVLLALGILKHAAAALTLRIHVYVYVSSDGSWEDVEVPEKGRHFADVQESFARYRAEHGIRDATMCRTFSTPSEWDSSVDRKHPRWQLPFKAADAKP